MAGVTHSAFRRLVADFGGYGALLTEMLSGAALRCENLAASPFTKKRTHEGAVIYQLYLTGREDIALTVERLRTIEPFGIDINLGCPAPEIRKGGGGVELFDDRERLAGILAEVRRSWKGLLTVKCRLGKRRESWRDHFADRMRLFEESGVDAVTVHPRFSDEKLKRTARWELFPWIVSLTRLPVIVNGDIALHNRSGALALLEAGGCRGLMIGRMAAVKPWIFREFTDGIAPPIDFPEVWTRLYDYTLEDFPPEKAIGRIKEFTAYYARNFMFGHELFRRVQSAPDLSSLKSRAQEFLGAEPQTVREPDVMGI
jgi:tRNA-dihydrouridine synthase B